MKLYEILVQPDLLNWNQRLAHLITCLADEDISEKILDVLHVVVNYETCLMMRCRLDGGSPSLITHNIPACSQEIHLDKYLSFAYHKDPMLEKINDDNSQIIRINQNTHSLIGSSYYHDYYCDLDLQDEINMLFFIGQKEFIVITIGMRKSMLTKDELLALNSIYHILNSIIVQHYNHPKVIAHDCDRRSVKAKASIDTLTEREREIVNMMISGQGTKMLARELGISYQTVKVHRKNIYNKLGINSELQLCSMFINNPSLERLNA